MNHQSIILKQRGTDAEVARVQFHSTAEDSFHGTMKFEGSADLKEAFERICKEGGAIHWHQFRGTIVGPLNCNDLDHIEAGISTLLREMKYQVYIDPDSNFGDTSDGLLPLGSIR